MLQRLILLLTAASLFTVPCFASQTTVNYNLVIPAEGDVDWISYLSNDIISIDAILADISGDSSSVGIISSDVGDLKNKQLIISSDVGVLKIEYTIISNDAVDWENNRASGDSAKIDTLSADTFRLNTYLFPTGAPSDNYIIKYDAGTGIFNYEPDVGESGNVSSITEGVASPIVLSSTTGDVVITMQSADSTTAGYVSSANYNTWTSDRVSTDANLSSLQINSAYTFPTSNGSAGQVLTTDSGGVLGFTTLSRFIQEQHTISSDAVVYTTQIPADDSIPQISEGSKFMEVTITPKSATNILRIDVVFNGTASSASQGLVVALFQDATANALAAVSQFISNTDGIECLSFSYYMVAGTTSATTFTVRAGHSTGGTTVTMNGIGGSRILGGSIPSLIRVAEYEP